MREDLAAAGRRRVAGGGSGRARKRRRRVIVESESDSDGEEETQAVGAEAGASVQATLAAGRLVACTAPTRMDLPMRGHVLLRTQLGVRPAVGKPSSLAEQLGLAWLPLGNR